MKIIKAIRISTNGNFDLVDVEMVTTSSSKHWLEPNKKIYKCKTCEREKGMEIHVGPYYPTQTTTYTLYYSDVHNNVYDIDEKDYDVSDTPNTSDGSNDGNDGNDKPHKCTAKENPYAGKLLEMNCNCGYVEVHDNFQGDLYFIKNDINLAKKINHKYEKLDYGTEYPIEEIEKRDCTIDCTENDMELIMDNLDVVDLTSTRRCVVM